LRRRGYAALALFLDARNNLWQVNASYVVPGTTVARTVAWKPEELKAYFSRVTFSGGRLVLKSAGRYADLPVIREVRR
jgi:hypothetical protein